MQLTTQSGHQYGIDILNFDLINMDDFKKTFIKFSGIGLLQKYKKLHKLFVLTILVVIGISHFYLKTSDPNMEITAFCSNPDYIELDKFNNWSSCNDFAKPSKVGCGCMRTDGLFSLIKLIH